MIELLINAVYIFSGVLHYLILFRIVMSWLPIGGSNPAVQFLFSITEPILAPIRRLLQNSPLGGSGMMIDFSPILAFLLLRLGTEMIITMLSSFI